MRQLSIRGALIFLCGLWLAGCNSATAIATPTATAPVATATIAPTATALPASPTAVSIPVKVYFSKHPDSDNDPTKVFPVNRVAPSLKVGTYALEQLVAGPQAGETGLYSQVKALLPAGAPASGDATCHSGVAFALTVTSGVARMQFCTATSSGGIGDDSRVINEITATLKQFNTVTTVKICTASGGIFGDESGQPKSC
jgi:hypothetical protein